MTTMMEALARVPATTPNGKLLAGIAKCLRALSDRLFPPLVSTQERLAGLDDFLLIAPSCGEWLDPRLWDLLNEVGKAAEAKSDKTKRPLNRSGAL